MRTESSDTSQHRDAAGEAICGCIPHPERQEGVGRISGCACEGVDRIVTSTKKRRTGDIVKVAAFVTVLAALVVGIALWL
jgi:hypothetical protein